MSITAAQYARSVEPDRLAWRESVPQRCMWCGTDEGLSDVHEITPRSAAPRRWWHRCNALLLCRRCHDCVWDMSDAHALALKLVNDPQHFDLSAWLRIGDPELKAPERITMADIAAFLKVMDVA